MNFIKRYLPHILGFIAVAAIIAGSYAYIMAPLQGDQLGTGYNPVTGYQSRTTAFINSTAATIPVASTKDPAGNQITLSNISSSSTVKVYFNLEPGTVREEAIVCTGVTALSWTGCVRGLAFQGNSEAASTTLQIAHNAGAAIIMTNTSQFYNQFVSIDGDQTLTGVKTFYALPNASSTTVVPISADQFATKYYVDNVGAGGFTAANVSSTLGLQAISAGIPSCTSAAACVGINISTTSSGLYFDNTFGGKLAIYTYATSGLAIGSDGKIYLDTTDNQTWRGEQIFGGNSTATAIFAVQNPTSTLDAANRFYVDQQVSASQATGTAGIAITAGNALYISTTGTLFLADADATSTSQTFAGIAINTVAVGAEVRFVKPGGVAITTGLNAGQDYYLSGTAGSLTATYPTAPTLPVKVGTALSATRFLVKNPTINIRTSAALGTFTTDQFVSLGIIPTRVDVICGSFPGTVQLSQGWWVLNQDGTSSTASWGVDDDAIPYIKTTLNAACKWEEGTNEFIGVVIATSTHNTAGFIVRPLDAWPGAARNATYIAEYTYP